MKNIVSIAIAIFVGFIIATLIFSVLSIAIGFVFFSIKMLFFVFLIAIFALPIYAIANKSLFSGKKEIK